MKQVVSRAQKPLGSEEPVDLEEREEQCGGQ
jgi:hypothetical protein